MNFILVVNLYVFMKIPIRICLVIYIPSQFQILFQKGYGVHMDLNIYETSPFTCWILL